MKRKFILFVLAPLGFAAFVAIGGGVVQWLWNGLLPGLFGWPQIGFWQALGLLVLCRILFGGFGFSNSSRSNARRRMEEQCAHMTPEEREQMRQRMRERFGFGSRMDESKQQ